MITDKPNSLYMWTFLQIFCDNYVYFTKEFQIMFNSNYHFGLGEKEKNPKNHEKLLTKYFVTNIWSNSLTYS